MADSARLDELRRQFEGNPRRYFAPLASALRRGGDATAAVTLARAQLAEYPGHLTGHVILGQALLDAGDPGGARDAFARAAALDEGNVVALQQLVTLARDAGDAAAARQWTARLVEADPELAAELSAAPAATFEPLDLEDMAADADGAESFTAATLDPNLAVDAERRAPEAPVAHAQDETAFDAFEVAEPVPMDPVVGLDVPPEDPLPVPMREALPELLDAGRDERVAVSAPMTGQRAEPADDRWADDAVAAPPAAPFVTETMAALLVAQGHAAQAADVYERLLAQRPDDEGLRARLAELRGAAAEVPSEAPNDVAGASGVMEAPEAFAAAAAPMPEGPDDADERAARMWRAAFAPLPPEAARDAAVFDDPSFDHFSAEATAAPASVASAPSDDPDEDLAQFNAWLRGLAE